MPHSRIVSMLAAAGAEFDFVAALNLKRYDLAAAMLKEDPSRIGARRTRHQSRCTFR